jgi:hypothetical protein
VTSEITHEWPRLTGKSSSSRSALSCAVPHSQTPYSGKEPLANFCVVIPTQPNRLVQTLGERKWALVVEFCCGCLAFRSLSFCFWHCFGITKRHRSSLAGGDIASCDFVHEHITFGYQYANHKRGARLLRSTNGTSRLSPSRHGIPQMSEYSSAILYRPPPGYRRAGRCIPHGFWRMVRGFPGCTVAYLRCAITFPGSTACSLLKVRTPSMSQLARLLEQVYSRRLVSSLERKLAI